jgi:hypothetical protein
MAALHQHSHHQPNTAGVTTMKLSGDRCQCAGCGHYFNSTRSFDMHRRGDFGKERRCLSLQEMKARGMTTNAAGFWITHPRALPHISLAA